MERSILLTMVIWQKIVTAGDDTLKSILILYIRGIISIILAL